MYCAKYRAINENLQAVLSYGVTPKVNRPNQRTNERVRQKRWFESWSLLLMKVSFIRKINIKIVWRSFNQALLRIDSRRVACCFRDGEAHVEAWSDVSLVTSAKISSQINFSYFGFDSVPVFRLFIIFLATFPPRSEIQQQKLYFSKIFHLAM